MTASQVKLLFDQNLSYTLVASVSHLFPGSAHVRDFQLESADDEVVWDYAKQHAYVVVSKDSDFRHRSFARGAPPKVIWVAVGNCSTERIKELLVRRAIEIIAFERDTTAAFLELR